MGVRRSSAPHARGCSPLAAGGEWGARVGPARAGMLPAGRRRTRYHPRRPRTRGDAPKQTRYRGGLRSSAPHARGCSGARRSDRGEEPVGPARAGMLPHPQSSAGAGGRRPRTRGDAPEPLLPLGSWKGSAPHARGCSPDRAVPMRRRRVGPARAGMLPPRRTSRRTWTRRPRTRGDAPHDTPQDAAGARSAPHLRGCSEGRGDGRSGVAVVPAPAGALPATESSWRSPSSTPAALRDHGLWGIGQASCGVTGSCRQACGQGVGEPVVLGDDRHARVLPVVGESVCEV